MSNTIYSGYVYIWYDTKAKFFYIGGHKGKIEDKYISSSKVMKHAYQLRPQTFKFRVLEYVSGDVKQLRIREQYWLDKIKNDELMTSENVRNKTCKYYNVKKSSSGGNGLANKGKSKPAWNKGYSNIELELRRNKLLCLFPLDKPKSKIKKEKKLSEDQKIKISNSLKGFKHSDISKLRMSIAAKNRNKRGRLDNTVLPQTAD